MSSNASIHIEKMECSCESDASNTSGILSSSSEKGSRSQRIPKFSSADKSRRSPSIQTDKRVRSEGKDYPASYQPISDTGGYEPRSVWSDSRWSQESWREHRCGNRDRCERSNEDSCGFKALITPLYNVVSTSNGLVEFMMRRKNKVVTLQWEEFTAQIAGNGVAYLVVQQSICNLPPFPVDLVGYHITYNGTGKLSFIRVDPNSVEQIKFFLDATGNSISNNGDTIIVVAGSVSWITE